MQLYKEQEYAKKRKSKSWNKKYWWQRIKQKLCDFKKLSSLLRYCCRKLHNWSLAKPTPSIETFRWVSSFKLCAKWFFTFRSKSLTYTNLKSNIMEKVVGPWFVPETECMRRVRSQVALDMAVHYALFVTPHSLAAVVALALKLVISHVCFKN